MDHINRIFYLYEVINLDNEAFVAYDINNGIYLDKRQKYSLVKHNSNTNINQLCLYVQTIQVDDCIYIIGDDQYQRKYNCAKQHFSVILNFHEDFFGSLLTYDSTRKYILSLGNGWEQDNIYKFNVQSDTSHWQLNKNLCMPHSVSNPHNTLCSVCIDEYTLLLFYCDRSVIESIHLMEHNHRL